MSQNAILSLGLGDARYQRNGSSAFAPINPYSVSQVPFKAAPSAPFDTYSRTSGQTKIYVASATGTWTDGRYGGSVTIGAVGNDSTGNGSAATPYATIAKALNIAQGNGAGAEIIVAPGTITEGGGGSYGFIPGKPPSGSRQASAPTVYSTVRSLTLNGVVNTNAYDVTIQASNAATSGIIYLGSTNGWGYVDFWGLAFTQSAGLNPGANPAPIIYINSAAATQDFANIRFDTCQFNLATPTSGYPVVMYASSEYPPNNLVFIGNTFVGLGGTTQCYLIQSTLFDASGVPATGFKFLYNTISNFAGAWDNGYCGGFASPMIIGNDLPFLSTSSGTHGILLGQDGVYSGSKAVTEPYTAGNYISHPSHNLIHGGGCSGGIIEHNRCVGGIHGVVVKEHTQNSSSITTNVRFNYCNGTGSGQLTSLYNKASLYAGFFENLAVGNNSNTSYQLFEEGIGDTSNKPGWTTAISNRFVFNNASSTQGALNWQSSSNVQGNSQSYYNIYEIRSGTWGTVRGTSVSSVATLAAAWKSAGVGTETTSNNDGNSQLYSAATELGTFYTSGKTVYAIIERSDGYVWNGSAFVAFRPVDAWNFALWLYEQAGGTARYSRDCPRALPVGAYKIRYYACAGDLPVPVGYTNRNGLAVAAADTLISVEPFLVSQ